jgi:hypothetical protein
MHAQNLGLANYAALIFFEKSRLKISAKQLGKRKKMR